MAVGGCAGMAGRLVESAALLLGLHLFRVPRPDVFVVQSFMNTTHNHYQFRCHNPPSVPTLAAVKLASWLRGAKFIVDWHNFGYTLLGLSHGRSHIIVKIYFWFEKHFGQMADGAFCVTKAMQHELAQNWGIRLGNSICSAMGNADCKSVGEVRRADLAAVVEEETEVDGHVEVDAQDVGLDGGAEADGGVQVDEALQQRTALVVLRGDVELQ
ncbi:unnamed protein product [Miscanthus lutarioriparius]|uniref:Glycosyltransferase subfamily 4-like N-terminal domain-containing protein n=1 Tax=Miscanthus lutarioriparius TaxID=422564 RepID=A0A811RJ18_9POAL|nr:unnamed protein product [Miscanthus lutarioriparius]